MGQNRLCPVGSRFCPNDPRPCRLCPRFGRLWPRQRCESDPIPFARASPESGRSVVPLARVWGGFPRFAERTVPAGSAPLPCGKADSARHRSHLPAVGWPIAGCAVRRVSRILAFGTRRARCCPICPRFVASAQRDAPDSAAPESVSRMPALRRSSRDSRRAEPIRRRWLVAFQSNRGHSGHRCGQFLHKRGQMGHRPWASVLPAGCLHPMPAPIVACGEEG